MVLQGLGPRAIWNDKLYQSLEDRALWLHIALERQVARGMAWLDAWGQPRHFHARLPGVVHRPRRKEPARWHA
jgi:hypothetical protein